MRTRHRQRGFLLNPYRFEGTVQEGACAMEARSVATFAGASIAAATAAATAEADLIGDSDQAASGAISAVGDALMTMEGAAIASAVASADGASDATINASSFVLECDAADFDSTNDWLTRATAFSPAPSASKQGIFSAWVYFDALDVNGNPLLATYESLGDSTVQITVTSAGVVQVAFNTTSTNLLNALTGAGAVTTGAWKHILSSWDLSAGAVHMYVDDVDEFSSGTPVDMNIPYNDADEWLVGSFDTHNNVPPANAPIDAGLAELYFAPGQFLDFSVEENRRKFISSGGKPVDLGSTGASPTGTEPLIYLHLDAGEAAANFAINRAGKGNFTVTGSLTTYGSSPSD